MLIYLPVFLSFRLSLSLLLPLFLSSVNHGSRLHRRRQFAGHTKRVDNLKGKSSLLTQEGHRTTNARASCSVEHNTSRWTRRALRYRFRSVGRAQHYHMDPRPPDPRSFGLTSHFLAHRWHSPLLALSACFCPSLNSRMLLGFAYWKHKSYAREERQSRVNKSLKRPPFFLILRLFAMVYFSQDTNVISPRICDLFL